MSLNSNPSSPRLTRSLIAAMFLVLTAGSTSAAGLTIYATGMMRGTLEKCGCLSKQTGGVEPLAGYLAKQQKDQSDYILVDIGGFLTLSRNTTEEAIDEMYIRAMSTLGYTAVGLGRQEMMTPPERLLPLLELAEFPIVAANLKLKDSTLKAPWQSSVVIERAGKKIAITGVAPALPPIANREQYYEAESLKNWPVERLQEAVGQPVDLIVLLAYEPYKTVEDWLSQKAANFETPIVVFTQTWTKLSANFGRHTAVCLRSAKYLNRADIDFEKENPVFNNGLVSLDPSKYNDQDMHALLDSFYLEFEEKLGPDAKIAPLSDLSEEIQEGNGYAGAESCIACHEPEYQQWHVTRHKRAFLTLLNRQRFFDPQCVGCHTTGYGHPKGFSRYTVTPQLEGVQCESCHGPSKLHNEKPEEFPLRTDLGKEFCARCHNKEHDPTFDARYLKAWTEVAHKPGAQPPDVPAVQPVADPRYIIPGGSGETQTSAPRAVPR